MKYFSEETRKKMSDAAKRRCNATWRKQQSEARATKIDTELVRNMYNAGMSQTEIAKVLGTTQKVIHKHMKNHNIPTRPASKRNQFGTKNHMWKDKSASIKAFHKRVEKRFGKAKDYGCSICGKTDEDAWYDWANLSGNYYDINDYAPMCRSCHRKYDVGRKNGGNNLPCAYDVLKRIADFVESEENAEFKTD